MLLLGWLAAGIAIGIVLTRSSIGAGESFALAAISRVVGMLALALCAASAWADGDRLRDPGVLRVGSQNLLHDFPKFYKVHVRLVRVAEEIRRLDLDIVGFQESAWVAGVGVVPKKIAKELGYHYAFFKLERAGFMFGFENGIAIISRYPILEKEHLEFRHQKGIFEERSVMRALIQTPAGLVNFYSAHLSGDSDKLNLKQTREMVAFIDKHRGDGLAFLAGDFNFYRNESAPRYLAQAGYIDTFTAANPGRDNASCCTCIEAGYSNWFDDCPEHADHTFVEADDKLYLIPGMATHGEVLASDFIMDAPFREAGRWLWISDHKGIRAEVRLSALARSMPEPLASAALLTGARVNTAISVR